MKTKFLSLIIALICCTSVIANTTDIYEKYRNKKGVTVIVVSKALLNLVPSTQSGKLSDMDFGMLGEKLDGLHIFTSDNRCVNRRVRKAIKKEAKSANFESLMSMSEKKQELTFYTQKQGDIITKIIVFANGMRNAKNLSIIEADGRFSTDDLQKISNMMKK